VRVLEAAAKKFGFELRLDNFDFALGLAHPVPARIRSVCEPASRKVDAGRALAARRPQAG
jgi:hypothetical protein